MSVLKLEEMELIVKMAQGNPGAITAIVDLMAQTPQIEIRMFDVYGISGSGIYILWNDKCGKDWQKVNLLFQAVQLGFLPVQRIQELAADQNNVTPEEWATIGGQIA